MIINHNLTSMNICNQLNKTSNNKSTSIKKLSSGLRINKAGDDAAGLAISEKMRGQIRGLDQASRNTQDGISMIQTAEAGLNEIHSLLQRCRELSVQSANSTYTDYDRNFIQNEFTELIEEVGTISTNTKFNTLSLLDGKYNKDGIYVPSDSLDQYVHHITTSGGITETYTYASNNYASAIIDFSNINSAGDVANLIGKGVNYTCCTCSKAYSIKFVNGSPDTSRLNAFNPVMEVDVSSITNGTDLVNKIIETAYGQPNFIYIPTPSNGGIPIVGTDIPSNATSFVDHYSQLAFDGAKLYIYDDRPSQYGFSWPSGGSGVFNLNVYGEEEEKEDKFLYLDIQTGSNAGQSVRVKISNVTVDQLGIDGLLVDTQNNASLAITKLDAAITNVSNARSNIGAYQNRLEHAINSINNSSENLQNAESRIRDADIAKEMMIMSKDNILEQVAKSLLAQSNQMPNRVLDLLN